MNFDSSLIVYFSITVAVLGITAAALALSFLPVLRWLSWLMEKEWQRKAAVRRAAEEIMAAARAQELKILQAANAQAAQVLTDSQLWQDEAKVRWEQAFAALLERHLPLLETAAQKMTADYQVLLDDYRQALQKAEAANLEKGQAAAAALEGKMLTQLRGFEDILREQAAAAAKKLEEITAAYSRRAQQEVEDDKAARFRQLDETIFRLVFRVVEKVLGRALSLQEHQELITRALNDAKRDEMSHL